MRSAILKKSAILIGALLTGAVSVVGVSCAAEPKRHPAAHVIRITAGLTFDGKPVEIDDLIDCQATYTGTPTSTPHMVFRPNRGRITHEVPGGGMITFQVSRELCFVNGDDWGSATPAYTAPEGWTPVLEWYDHRDPRKAETGIFYLSETAVYAENGRLRIVRPFRIMVPEHPSSRALINEAERQAIERNYYLDPDITQVERLAIGESPMPWMIRIPESEWRNPERARVSSEVGRYRRKPEPDFQALERFLSRQSGAEVITLGYLGGDRTKDYWQVLKRLRDGRFPTLYVYNLGIPRENTDRFGLLVSDGYIKKNSNNPLWPDRFDEYVPLACFDGVVSPIIATLGIKYWYKERCNLPEHFRGTSFSGSSPAGKPCVRHDCFIFDTRSGELWWLAEG